MTQLEIAKETLENKSVHKEVKALLLLRICTLQRLAGKTDSEFFDLLHTYAKYLKKDDKASYESLGLRPEKQKRQKGGFVADTIKRIEDARIVSAGGDSQKAKTVLLECEESLAKKWWCPGKTPAWSALLYAWSLVDRSGAVVRIKRLPRKQRPKALHMWNQQQPLAQKEWTIVADTLKWRQAYTIPADGEPNIDVIDKLAKQKNQLTSLLQALFFEENDKVVRALPEQLIPVAATAIEKIFLKDELEKQVSEEHTKGLEVFVRVMGLISETNRNAAIALGLWACKRASENPVFEKDFSFAYLQLVPIVMQTAETAKGSEEVLSRLLQLVRDVHADFIRVYWYVVSTKSADSARQYYQKLQDCANDKINATRLYLVNLTQRGNAEVALSLAGQSSEKEDLLLRVKRAWLCTDPGSAQMQLTAEDFPHDNIVQLLLLKDDRARGEFLCQLTNHGKKDLPNELWSAPGLVELMEIQAGRAGASKRQSLYGGFYVPVTDAQKRFSEYVRLHGYGFLSNETVDPCLLSGFIAWRESQPEEVENLVRRMAKKMELDEQMLMIDVVRNTTFTRCRAVLPVVPEVFLDKHVDWIKTKLVDNQVRIQVDANTIRTLSMPSHVPFLFAIMGAENVAKFSRRLCEETIAQAMKRYQIDSKYLPIAAHLYASDSGLEKLEPPCRLLFQKREWQKGVVAAAAPLLAAEILEKRDNVSQDQKDSINT